MQEIHGCVFEKSEFFIEMDFSISGAQSVSISEK